MGNVSKAGVKSLAVTGSNGITGAVNLTAGSNITLSQSGQAITVTGSAASGGQTLVTKVVAASGGDYTTLGAAIAAASAGWTIFVTAGTYVESTISYSLARVSVIGENPEQTVISMGANNFTCQGAFNQIRGVKFLFTTGVMQIDSDDFEMLDCHYSKSGSGLSDIDGQRALIQGCRFASTQTDDAVQWYFQSPSQRIVNNYFIFDPTCTTDGTIKVAGNSTVFTGNYVTNVLNGMRTGTLIKFPNTSAATVSGNSFVGDGNNTGTTVNFSADPGTFTGNFINNGNINLILGADATCTGNTLYNGKDGIQVNGNDVVISGNYLFGTDTTGTHTGVRVLSGKDRCSIIGNKIYNWATGVVVTDSTNDNTSITSNYFSPTLVTTPISDAGTLTTVEGNSGTSARDEKVYARMQNVSGTTLSAGNIVVRYADAQGDRVTTTSTAGATNVFGVVAETMSNSAYGKVQVRGYTATLAVDGTADIAIGDYIAAFSTARYGYKAAIGTTILEGDTGIAYALQAYSTDSSSGIISAIIIPPIKV